MINTRRFIQLAVMTSCLALPTGAASAAAMNSPAPAQNETPAPAETLAPTPPSAEQLSLQGFGLQNASCLEWSDLCTICARDEGGAMKCSTPGIACQPEAIVCRREKAK